MVALLAGYTPSQELAGTCILLLSKPGSPYLTGLPHREGGGLRPDHSQELRLAQKTQRLTLPPLSFLWPAVKLGFSTFPVSSVGGTTRPHAPPRE